MYCKKGVLRNFTKFIGKHLCQSLLFNKLQVSTLLIKKIWQRCFPVNFVKFLRTLFLTEHLWWLLMLMNLWTIFNYLPHNIVTANVNRLRPLLLGSKIYNYSSLAKLAKINCKRKRGNGINKWPIKANIMLILKFWICKLSSRYFLIIESFTFRTKKHNIIY